MPQCAECGKVYGDESFCPRCGSMKQTGAPVEPRIPGQLPPRLPPPRRDPARRLRARMGGAALLAFSLIVLTSLVVGLFEIPDRAEALAPFVKDQPGGMVTIEVRDGLAKPDVNFTIAAWDGPSYVQNHTSAGSWTGSAGGHAAFWVNVTRGNDTWSQRAVVPQSMSITLRFDLHETPGAAPKTHFAPTYRTLVQASLSIGIVLMLPVAAGGIAALRLKAPRLAVGGTAIALLPAAILLAVASLQTVLVAGFIVAAFLMVVLGRREFG